MKINSHQSAGSLFDYLKGNGLLVQPKNFGSAPHATTIIALKYQGGVLMAGDRRATSGNWIAASDMEKVFAADSTSVIGAAGVAGLAQDLIRLFQMELEHFEKVNGDGLSLDGRATRLAGLVRANLELAMADYPVIPLYIGRDGTTPRIFSFDAVGGKYEETEYAAVGSGALFARGSLKKLVGTDISEKTAIEIALTSLADAADEDTATGGVNQGKAIWPVVYVVDSSGSRRIEEAVLGEIYQTSLAKLGEKR